MKPALSLRAACTLLLFAFAACQREAPVTEKSPTPVRSDTATLYQPETGRRYSASIIPYRQVTLSFRSAGFVDWILEVRGADGRMRPIGPGDPVKEGEVLARVRRKDYDSKVGEAEGQVGVARRTESSARAQLSEAEASAVKAAEDFQRATKLFGTASITKPDYDSAKAQQDTARARVDSARAQMDAATSRIDVAQGSLNDAGLARSDTEMAAPFPGFVIQRQVEIGALVSSGMAGISLAELSPVKAVFGLPDLEVAGFRTGASLSLSTEALPGRQFRGTVTAISPVADSNTRLFPVEITVPNPKNVLLAGMIATVESGVAKRAPVLVVPLGAVVRGKDTSQFAVMTVEGSSGQTRARSRQVTLGETFGNRIQILGGLHEGDRVVVSGPSLLADNDVIRVIP